MLKRFRSSSIYEADTSSETELAVVNAEKRCTDVALSNLQATTQQEIKELKHVITRLNSEKSELESECKKWQIKAELLLNEKDAERSRANEIERSLSNRLDRVVKACNKVESSYVDETELLHEESLQDKRRLTELEMKNSELEAKLSELTSRYDVRTRRLNELESYVSEKQTELNDLATLKASLEKLERENKSLQERLTLEEKRTSLPDGFHPHPKGVTYVTKLEMECERLRTSYKNLSKERAEWLITKEENHDLRTQVDQLKQWRQRALTAENALAEKNDLNSSLNASIPPSTVSRTHVKRLERENELLLAEQDELRARIDELQADLDSATRRLTSNDCRPQPTCNFTVSQVSETPIQRFNHQENVKEREATVELRRCIAQLEAQLAESESSKMILQEQLIKMEASGVYDPKTTKILTLNANPMSEIQASLSNEVSQLRRENERYRQRNKVLEDCLIRLRERQRDSDDQTNAANETTVAVGSVTMMVNERLQEHPDPLTELAGLREELRVERLRQDRLMEMFDKASAKFRGACRGLLGFRLEVKPSGDYKIRSIFATDPNDFILFKKTDGRFEIQETEYSRNLPETVRSFLASEHSLPGLFASITLSFLQQETMII